jgi:hypothetical protein
MHCSPNLIQEEHNITLLCVLMACDFNESRFGGILPGAHHLTTTSRHQALSSRRNQQWTTTKEMS